MAKKRRKFAPAFKTKVALAAIRGKETVAELTGTATVESNAVLAFGNRDPAGTTGGK